MHTLNNFRGNMRKCSQVIFNDGIMNSFYFPHLSRFLIFYVVSISEKLCTFILFIFCEKIIFCDLEQR